jgi:hypothetical protein
MRYSSVDLFQRKTLGEPNDIGGGALEFNKNAVKSDSSLQPASKYVMGARDDGLVREEKENRVVSREDTTELTEVEDVKHFGDFSDKVSEVSLVAKTVKNAKIAELKRKELQA